jgi:hypothetical protein
MDEFTALLRSLFESFQARDVCRGAAGRRMDEFTALMPALLVKPVLLKPRGAAFP